MAQQEAEREKLGEVLEYFTEVTEAEIGKLVWQGDQGKFAADITGSFAPTALQRLLFRRIELVVHGYKMEGGTAWQFLFEYTHPNGGSNGKAIGVVFMRNDGTKHYRADGK